MYSVRVLALRAATDNGDTSALLSVGVVGGVCSSHVVVLLGFLLLLNDDSVVTADAGHWLELLAMLLLMEECDSPLAALARREHLLMAL